MSEIFDFQASRLSEYIDTADISINYDFLEKAITYQSIMEGVIGPDQFIKIIRLESDNEEKRADFTCEVFEYLRN